jgi:sortase A
VSRPHLPANVRRALRTFSTSLMAAGVVLLLDAGLTLVWQEPVSAVYAHFRQASLSGDLTRLEDQGPTDDELRALDQLESQRKKLGFLARSLRHKTGNGDAIGRLKIPKIGVSKVIVEGTDTGDLMRGPGRYDDSSLPGLPGTTAIAGHRTTYGAPFRSINKLKRGDSMTLEMPYGKFTYEVIRQRIVDPSDYGVTRSVPGQDRLVLTACHPLYSAAQRIVVFARLVRAEPRGAALRAEKAPAHA